MTSTMSQSTVLYTAQTHTTGGRHEGASRSSDGRLDVRFSTPGGAGTGTNPEQLFAAGWSACFIGAIVRASQAQGVVPPKDLAVDTEIDLVQGDDGYALRARLNVSMPGIDAAAARRVVDMAHTLCPYSKATRGNIDVTLQVA